MTVKLDTTIERWHNAISQAEAVYTICSGRKFQLKKRDGGLLYTTFNNIVDRTLFLLTEVIDALSKSQMECIQGKKLCDSISATIKLLESKEAASQKEFNKMDASCVFKFIVRIYKVSGNICYNRDEALKACKQTLIKMDEFLLRMAKEKTALLVTQVYKDQLHACIKYSDKMLLDRGDSQTTANQKHQAAQQTAEDSQKQLKELSDLFGLAL